MNTVPNTCYERQNVKILNFGSLNIDNVYQVDHMVLAGETQSSLGLKLFAGGKGLNQSVALARAGSTVYHAGAVGKQDGALLLNTLSSYGVNCDFIQNVNGPSGQAIIQVDKQGQNCILLFGGSNQQICREQINNTLASFSAGDYLLLQNEINEIAYIIENAHKQGLYIVLNPSPMNETIHTLPLDLIDCFLLNEIEAEELAGVHTKEKEILMDTLNTRFPQAQIVITLGERGSLCQSNGKRYQQDAFSVQAIDTTAAGDTFTGYFLSQYLYGKSTQEAMRYAAAASAIAVTSAGAAPSIPSLSEVETFLATH